MTNHEYIDGEAAKLQEVVQDYVDSSDRRPHLFYNLGVLSNEVGWLRVILKESDAPEKAVVTLQRLDEACGHLDACLRQAVAADPNYPSGTEEAA